MAISKRKPAKFREKSHQLFLRLTSLPSWAAYSLSVIVVLVSTFLLLQMQNFVAFYDHLHKGPSFVALYFIAIAIATFVGRLRAGLFAVLLSLFCTAYFLNPSSGMFVLPTMSNYVTLAIVIIVGGLVALGMDSLRNNTRLLIQYHDLLAAEQSRANREAVLNLIGQTVRTANNPEQVQAVAVAAVGRTLDVDRCYFIRFNLVKNSAIIGHYWRRDGKAELDLNFRASELGIDVQQLVASGKTIAFEDRNTESRLNETDVHADKMGARAGVVVPLFSEGQLESTLVVTMTDVPRKWDSSEIALVETVAAQSRVAFDAARLQQKEHNIAIQLQAALQPALSLEIPGVNIASFYRAALEEANVGGDFFDAFALGNGQYALLVGDVSGKGLAAASQVAAIRNMIRCLLQTVESIQAAIALLNHVLIKQDLLPAFATLFVGIYDPATLVLEYVSCGHEPALLYLGGSGGEIIHLVATGPVVGVFDISDGTSSEQLFSSARRRLEPGDALLLYTDGVCDAGVDTAHLLGIEGITAQMKEFFNRDPSNQSFDESSSAKDMLEYCFEQTERFADGVLRDDICLLAIVVKKDAVSIGRESQYDLNRLRIGDTLLEGELNGLSIDGQMVSNVDNKFLAINNPWADYESEPTRREMLAEIMEIATGGKLKIVGNSGEFPAMLEHASDSIDLGAGENVRQLRRAVRKATELAGLSEERADALEIAAGEAANNSLVHGAGGVGQVFWDADGSVQIKIEDMGMGISYEDLPRAVLERGYTTAGTLGHGFWIILQSVQRCWIKTNEFGTTLLLE
jgi:serine phosphatase RsbU (regulator of sigma subunit)/anti-sigma regulatory factor (Ser/Thr protein kinase)